MQRDLSQKVLTLKGEEFTPALTLELVLSQCCLGHTPGDEDMDLKQKLSLYNLGKKLNKGGVQDFSAEELSQMKERVSKGFSILVTGVVCDMLDKDYSPPQ